MMYLLFYWYIYPRVRNKPSPSITLLKYIKREFILHDGVCSIAYLYSLVVSLNVHFAIIVLTKNFIVSRFILAYSTILLISRSYWIQNIKTYFFILYYIKLNFSYGWQMGGKITFPTHY